MWRALVEGEAEPLQVVVDRDAQLVGDALARALQPQVAEVRGGGLGERDREDQRADRQQEAQCRASNGAWRSASRWSTISAIGHGLASSASGEDDRRHGRAEQRAPLLEDVGAQDAVVTAAPRSWRRRRGRARWARG